ncbi:MAG: FkbM family methyltransferase [Chloroflexota bacterium]|nr:FkbM family methyltransferase [Chloroflexota bacterium]
MNFGEGNDPLRSGEQRVLELIAQRVGIEPVIFDVGANKGIYTRELLSVFHDAADIWAFEPSPSCFRALEADLGGIPNVHLRNMGFSDREATAKLLSPGEGSKLGSLYDTSARLARFGMSVVLEEPITLTTLDHFCSSEGIDRIEFLKLDVEGHELSVLKGASALLDTKRIGAIQFEFAAANIESRTFFRDFFLLLSEHYDLYRVLQDGLYRIDRYKEAYEVFKRATNYLALLKDSVEPASG